MTQIPERLVGVSDISSDTGRLVKNIKINNLPTGNQSNSHATPALSDSANRGEERRDEEEEEEEGQFIISNTSLAPPGNGSQEAEGIRQKKKVQRSGTTLIPTDLPDFPSSPGFGPGRTTTEERTSLSSVTAEPETPAVRKYKKETTILEPTFLFSTQTSTFTAAMKSHFFKVATVEANSSPTEENWNKLEYEIVTESSQSQLVSEDMTEVIIIRKCSYCGFINYSWL